MLPGLEGEPVEVTPANAPDSDRIYKGIDKSGQILGYAACGEAQGYSSKIKVMVGVDSHFEKVLGISVLAQNETPRTRHKDDRGGKQRNVVEPDLWKRG